MVLPATSVAVQVSDFAPVVVVFTGPHEEDAIPEPPVSVAFALAVTEAPYRTRVPPIVGESVGASTGATVSTLTVVAAVRVLPATSLHDAVSTWVPWPLLVDVAGRPAGSTPEPSVSVQLQLTVTGALFHPAPFATGACVGVATGAMPSMLTVREAVRVLPTLSVQDAVSVWVP